MTQTESAILENLLHGKPSKIFIFLTAFLLSFSMITGAGMAIEAGDNGGADLSSYKAPGTCNTVESTASDIETALNNGNTVVCVDSDLSSELTIDEAGVTVASDTDQELRTINVSGEGTRAVTITADDVTLKGFEVTGAETGTNAVRGEGVQGVELSYLEVHDNDVKGVRLGKDDAGNPTSNAVIEHVEVYNNNGLDEAVMEDDRLVDGTDGITLYPADDTIIRHATVHDNGDNGVYLNGNNITAYDIITYRNGDEGIDISLDYNSAQGPITVRDIYSHKNNAEGIEVEDNEKKVTINRAIVEDNGRKAADLEYSLLLTDDNDHGESNADVIVNQSYLYGAVENSGDGSSTYGTIIAEKNYWGQAQKPSNQVGGDVDYTPWYTNKTFETLRTDDSIQETINTGLFNITTKEIKGVDKKVSVKYDLNNSNLVTSYADDIPAIVVFDIDNDGIWDFQIDEMASDAPDYWSYGNDGWTHEFEYRNENDDIDESLSHNGVSFYRKDGEFYLTVDSKKLSSEFKVLVWADQENDFTGKIDGNSSAVPTSQLNPVIEVAPGTYTEHVEITDPGITLKSIDGPESTTIEGSGSDNVTRVHPAANGVTVKGFTITQGDRRGIFVGEYSSAPDNTRIENNHIKNIGTSASSETHGILVEQGSTGTVIKNNTIEGIETADNRAVGISLVSQSQDESLSAEIENNTIRDITAETENDVIYGIELSHNVVSTSIINNTITNLGSDNAQGAHAIGLFEGVGTDNEGNDYRYGPKNFEIQGNNINGIKATDYNTDPWASPSSLFVGGYEDLGDDHIVTQNNLINGVVRWDIESQTGFDPAQADVLDVTHNWWGTTDKSEIEDKISGGVNYAPWLDSDSEPIDIVVGEENNFKQIQNAIDAVGEGVTIDVTPGTYNETIVINTSDLVLHGPNAEIPAYSSNRDSEAVVNADGNRFGILVRSQMGNVTVDGLTVKGWTVGGIGQGMSDSDGTTFHVLNNKIKAIDNPDAHGNSIQVTGHGSVVRGNDVEATRYSNEDPDWATSGILVEGVKNGLIADNVVKYIDGDLEGDFYYRGITIEGSSEKWNGPAEDNVVVNNTVEGFTTGISVQMDASNTTLTRNDILSNDIGVATRKYQTKNHNKLVSDEKPTDVKIHKSTILDNGVGIRNTIGMTLNATRNYWGDPTGPSRQVPSDSGLVWVGEGDNVSDDVDFTPWYPNEEMLSAVKKDSETGKKIGKTERKERLVNKSAAAEVVIDKGTVLEGSEEWDGIIDEPKEKNQASNEPSFTGQQADVEKVVEVGDEEAEINLSKPAKIVMEGEAGKRAGWTRPGEDFHEITEVCEDNFDNATEANESLSHPGECKVDDGENLTIWSTHFTEFVTFTVQETEDTSTGTSTSSGDSITVCEEGDWICTEWSNCDNGTQTRNCEKTITCTDLDELAPAETQSCKVETETQVQECPDCPEPTEWTKCTEGTHVRTNYRCSEDTEFECESYTEEQSCEVKRSQIGTETTGTTGRIVGSPESIAAGVILLFILAAGAYWRKFR